MKARIFNHQQAQEKRIWKRNRGINVRRGAFLPPSRFPGYGFHYCFAERASFWTWSGINVNWKKSTQTNDPSLPDIIGFCNPCREMKLLKDQSKHWRPNNKKLHCSWWVLTPPPIHKHFSGLDHWRERVGGEILGGKQWGKEDSVGCEATHVNSAVPCSSRVLFIVDLGWIWSHVGSALEGLITFSGQRFNISCLGCSFWDPGKTFWID